MGTNVRGEADVRTPPLPSCYSSVVVVVMRNDVAPAIYTHTRRTDGRPGRAERPSFTVASRTFIAATITSLVRPHDDIILVERAPFARCAIKSYHILHGIKRRTRSHYI